MNKTLFTSESVTEGHPDKVADQVSDAILDAILEQDPQARVACETSVTTGLVLVFGEITTTATIDIQAIVRKTLREIGYTRAKFGFDADACSVLVALDKQSPDIAQGVNKAQDLDEIGAGDQGLMFGFASNETEELMPLPISLAHKLARQLAEVRKNGLLSYLRPDGKTQVTIEYDEQGVAVGIDTILISAQHAPEVDLKTIEQDLIDFVIYPIIPAELLTPNTRFLINPTGRFVIGGPHGDAGLTGRKIIVDTYGGYARHGGGAFSGKDATKVDRSGAYACRYVAKNLVASGLVDKVEIQVSYAIGVAKPTSISIETFGTERVNKSTILKAIEQEFDLRPAGIIEMLELRQPIYRQTASYGHFGRTDVDLPWERLDKVEALKAYLNK